ncbi:MAG TPA: DUF6636 domain-containing protein [Sporichthyaceae bacterium]|jgi:hypothetical protein
MRQIGAAVGIALSVVVLAGCGGGGGAKAQAAAPVPVPSAETSTVAPSLAPQAEILGTTVSDEVPYTDEAGVVTFTSPAHDINCAITDAPHVATCQLPTFSYKPAGKNQCKGNGVWGSTLELTAAKPIFVCATDAVVATKALDYGKRIEDQDLICVSKQDGITCFNARTNHGFRVAQGYYTVY